MSDNLKNFKKLVSNEVSPWLQEAEEDLANEAWLMRSSHIAIRILDEIHRQKPINGMTQKKLAKQMDVSAQYINKVVKGRENLSLHTITKIENVLGITLIKVPETYSSTTSMVNIKSSNTIISKRRSLAKKTMAYCGESFNTLDKASGSYGN